MRTRRPISVSQCRHPLLQHAQVDAWSVADAALSAAVGSEVHFFAAQTMRMKIQLAFTEVPEESHASLRDALCHSIGTLGGTSPLLCSPLLVRSSNHAGLALELACRIDRIQSSSQPAHLCRVTCS